MGKTEVHSTPHTQFQGSTAEIPFSAPLCGLVAGFGGLGRSLHSGAVWDSPEKAHDNGSRQPHQMGIWPALEAEGAVLSLGVWRPSPTPLPVAAAAGRSQASLGGPRPVSTSLPAGSS
jgi:hypothetical protein